MRGSATAKIPFERDEVEELLRKAREFRPWLYPILRLAFSTGLRRGELLGLRWDDIDWPRGRIHLARQINWLTLKPIRRLIPPPGHKSVTRTQNRAKCDPEILH